MIECNINKLVCRIVILLLAIVMFSYLQFTASAYPFYCNYQTLWEGKPQTVITD
jgi:hypothetical protein